MRNRRLGGWRSKLMAQFGCCVVIGLAAATAGAGGLADEPPTSSGQLGDVARVFAALPDSAQGLSFSCGEQRFPPGGHLQGMQLWREAAERLVLALAHDSLSVGYFALVEFAAGSQQPGQLIHVQQLPSDGRLPPLRHAGGIQVCDHVLAVGVEDNQAKRRSQVQFWDIADPRRPALLEHLTIRRAGSRPMDMTAGAVGLIRHADGYLLAVANWDSRAIDFYATRSRALAEPSACFRFVGRWEVARADTSSWQPDGQFGSYQAVNLVTGESNSLFIVGFDTNAAGQNRAELFAVDLKMPPGQWLKKIASRPFALEAGSQFRNAAGLAVLDGKLQFLASPQHFQPNTRASIVGLGTQQP